MKGNKKRRKVNAKGRNDTEQYVPMPYTMVRHRAWRSLSGPAVKVWVELRSRFNGRNNGDLSLSLDEAARLLGIGKTTALRAFAELEAKGFIKMTRRGQWYGRMATTWAVTDRSHKGHLPSRDWKNWTPDPKPQKQVLGTETEHIEAPTVPPQDRRTKICSATVPVRGVSSSPFGTETEHL